MSAAQFWPGFTQRKGTKTVSPEGLFDHDFTISPTHIMRKLRSHLVASAIWWEYISEVVIHPKKYNHSETKFTHSMTGLVSPEEGLINGQTPAYLCLEDFTCRWNYGNNAYREEDNTRVYNRSFKDLLNSFRSSLHDALVTVGCFTGIESNPPLHIPINGFP